MAEYIYPDFKKDSIKEFEKIYELSLKAPSGSKILKECLEIANLLINKNISYGSSFDKPINIFSNATPGEQILVRIDDKLNRIKNGKEYATEDTVLDLIGYLTLYRVLENSNIND
jgi:hypothetical protein